MLVLKSNAKIVWSFGYIILQLKKMKQLYMEGGRNEITWNASSQYSQLGSIFAVAQ